MKFQNFVSALTVLFGIFLLLVITVTATLFKKKPTAGRAPDRPQHGTANNVAHTHHYHTTINTARRRAVITLLCSYSFTLMMSSNQTSSSKTGGSGARRSTGGIAGPGPGAPHRVQANDVLVHRSPCPCRAHFTHSKVRRPPAAACCWPRMYNA